MGRPVRARLGTSLKGANLRSDQVGKVEHSTVSVVMATYNGQEYLSEQLESILGQTRPPDELVIGDDGSSDRTLEIIGDFVRSAPFPVHLLHREHVGSTANFLLSVSGSRGDLIAFADQDDVWLPEKLQVCLRSLQQYGADLVVHAADVVDANLRPVGSGLRHVRRPLVEEPLKGNLWAVTLGNTMLFRRGLLDGCDWLARPRGRLGGLVNHDDLVHLLALTRARSVWVPDKLLLYRQHGANAYGAPPALAKGLRAYHDHTRSLSYRSHVAQEWADYFSRLAPAGREAQTLSYFADAATRLLVRADRLKRPARKGMPAIVIAAATGEYDTHTRYGFGWRAMLQDLYYFWYRRQLVRSEN